MTHHGSVQKALLMQAMTRREIGLVHAGTILSLGNCLANTRVLAAIRPEANVSFLASRSGKEKRVGEEEGKGEMEKDRMHGGERKEEEETGETQSVITRNVKQIPINNILTLPLQRPPC